MKITRIPKTYNRNLIMKRAHVIHQSGLNMSEALKQAWTEIKNIRNMKKNFYERVKQIQAEEHVGFTAARILAETEIKTACADYIAA